MNSTVTGKVKCLLLEQITNKKLSLVSIQYFSASILITAASELAMELKPHDATKVLILVEHILLREKTNIENGMNLLRIVKSGALNKAVRDANDADSKSCVRSANQLCQNMPTSNQLTAEALTKAEALTAEALTAEALTKAEALVKAKDIIASAANNRPDYLEILDLVNILCR